MLADESRLLVGTNLFDLTLISGFFVCPAVRLNAGRDGRNRLFSFAVYFGCSNAGPGGGRLLRNGHSFGRFRINLDGRRPFDHRPSEVMSTVGRKPE